MKQSPILEDCRSWCEANGYKSSFLRADLLKLSASRLILTVLHNLDDDPQFLRISASINTESITENRAELLKKINYINLTRKIAKMQLHENNTLQVNVELLIDQNMRIEEHIERYLFTIMDAVRLLLKDFNRLND